MKKIINVIVILIVVAFVLFCWYFWSNFIRPQDSSYVNLDRAAVITEMKELQRLETATFTIEKIVDAGMNQDNKLKEILFGDKLLLIAQGQVIAGFDFSQMEDDDIKVEGTTLTITLPKPQILVTRLDNEQTRVYDRDTGIFSKGDKDLEAKAREQAELSIRDAACKANILTQASDNARKQLGTLFGSLGFSEVTIAIPEASCV